MFSQFMLTGLLLAIGVTGVIWWALKEFTNLSPVKVDGIAVVFGLTGSLTISLIMRGLIKDPLQVTLAIFVLILSYALFQWEQKRKKSSRFRKTLP